MNKIVLVALAMMGFTVAANAQRMDYEVLLSPLGLERAVRVHGEPCMMTTPYDLWARCGNDRVVPLGCPIKYRAFENGDLVCHSTQRLPTAPTHIRR